MNMSLSELLGVADQLDYSGSRSDFEAVRKHIVDSGAVVKTSKGEAIDFAKVSNTAATKTITIPETPAKPEPVATKAADHDVVVKAAVEAALKSAGIDTAATKRSGIILPDAEATIKVKGPDQRAWEAHAACNHGGLVFKTFERAALFRDMFVSETLGNHPKLHTDADWQNGVHACTKRIRNGVHGKAYGTFPNAAGGALTGTEFYPELIQNVLQYGAFGQLVRTVPMDQTQMQIPVATGIPTVNFPQENGTNTASTGNTFSNVQLNAKTAVCTAQLSKQILQDSNIALLDFFARDIARGFAYKRDQILFLSDGEATYGGMIGLNARFADLGTLSTVATNGGGVVVGGADAVSYTAAQLQKVVGICPTYARTTGVWTCTPTFWYTNMLRLALAQGGATAMEMYQGQSVPTYLGRPVILNELLNSAQTDAAGTIDAYFGDFGRGIVNGDRMSFEFDTDESIFFTSYAVAIRGVQRFDMVVNDIGTATTRGPIIALCQS